MLQQLQRIQREIRDYIDTREWVAPHAVTLTMRQAIQFPDRHRISLTPDLASQNFRHFLNILNRRMWGKAAERGRKSVQCFCVLEGGPNKRYHYHAVLDCPRQDLLEQFPGMVESAWSRTDWSYNQSDIQPFCDEGWINYISKFRDKPDYLSAFDWVNCHTG